MVLFFVWLMFFDSNNLLHLQSLEAQIDEMERECDYYRGRIEQDSLVIEGLKDSAFVERYARENYYFHAIEETLFIIKERE